MKKLFMAFVILLWTGTGIALTLAFNQENEEAVAQSFGAISCSDMAGGFTAEGSLKGEYLTGQEQQDLLKQIAEKIGITNNIQMQQEQDGNIRSVILNKQSEAANVQMKIMTREVEVEDDVIQTLQYFSMSLELKQYIEQIVTLKEEVESVLQQYPFKCSYGIEYQASFDGPLSIAEKNKLSTGLLKQIKADVVSENKTDELYTIYAYTDYIRDYEIINSKAVNVNLAFSYDEVGDCTYFYMATPYLKKEY